MTDPSLSQRPVPPAGWYRDPAHPGRQRWWDGVAWSSQVRIESQGAPVRPPAVAVSERTTTGPRPVHVVRRPAPAAPPAQAAPPASAGFALVPVRTTADGVALASIGRRIAATVLDTLVVWGATYSLLPVFVNDFQNRYWGAMYSAGQAMAAANGQGGISLTDDLTHVATIASYSVLGATVAYGLLGLMLWSRTLGQRALGIAVSPVDRGRDRINGPAAVSRTLLWTLLSQGGWLFWLLMFISLGLVVWHPKRQSLPDLLARTQVVRRG